MLLQATRIDISAQASVVADQAPAVDRISCRTPIAAAWMSMRTSSQLEIPPLRLSWRKLIAGKSPYEKFEHAIILVLTAAIVLLVTLATWHLVVAIVSLVLTDGLNPTDPVVFQRVFGMFFTVVIGLEFKHSLAASGSQESVVRARSIILIGMLATVRKFIVLDLATVNALELFAIAAAILALGIVYWLVRDQDHKTVALKAASAVHQARP